MESILRYIVCGTWLHPFSGNWTSFFFAMIAARIPQAAICEISDEIATPVTPKTGRPKKPYNEMELPTTLMIFAAKETYIASRV